MSQDLEQCRTALKSQGAGLLARANVVATGVGYKISGGQVTDELSIICSVVQKKEASSLRPEDMIPQSVGGVPTDVIETGEIVAFQDPKGRFRPAPGGVSLGHFDITAGTLGCLVRKNGQLHILSNNHVIANSNNARTGDAILQPGPFDGGRDPQDRIATLAEFVPINFQGGGGDGGGDGGGGGDDDGGCFGCAGGSSSGGGTGGWAAGTQAADNLVDAAIARPLEDSAVENTILDIGSISGTAVGTLGMALKKSGRTTEFTTGSVIQIDVTVDVSYGGGLIARFTDQLMAGAMSEGGDSGSAVLNDSNNLVGLLFAGSSTTTIINRIENVFSALNLTLA